MMRIAFFNWRDIRNPLAGGAEVYAHQLLRRLSSRGHVVTLFTSTFPGARPREAIDGVDHVRYGGKYGIYPKAFLCYKRNIEGRYDVIVESINGVPFFTPLFAKEKVVSLIHQLTRENWYSGLAPPLAFLGFHLEDAMLSRYRAHQAIAVSPSTKSDLEGLGFRSVEIIRGAADMRPPKAAKEKAGTLIYLGRLTRSKRVDHAILALKAVLDSGHSARLWIAGSGPEEHRLRGLSASLGISGNVRFFGKVDEETKAHLLSRAHLLLLPAVREGWGLVVEEANACRTPAIGYNVHGLRDSISEGINGYLVPDGDYNAMARKALCLLRDRASLKAVSESAKRHSKKHSWEKSCDALEAMLEGAIG